jgi:uncharacterized membrane protein YhaH (DUF805 family)
MALPTRERLVFLYRTEAGRIDRASWRAGVAGLAAPLVVLTLIMWGLLPYTAHDLATSPLFVWQTVVAYVYLCLYALAMLVVAASFVNLSAKRFRALGRPAPGGLATLLPLAALLAGSAHFLQPHVADAMPRWQVSMFDLLLAVIALWTAYELGVRDDDAR